MDGVVATNTTIARPPTLRSRHAGEAGGLSGAPLHEASVSVIRVLREWLGSGFPIVGVGGIARGTDAIEKIAAGASLVQLYTGLVYRGPQLVRESVDAVAAMHPDSIVTD
jgi:dihydroorotate dehydrogenase